MNKIILMIVFLLALSASGLMYFSGKDSDSAPQLSDYFWIPLPLALLAFVFLIFTRKNQ